MNRFWRVGALLIALVLFRSGAAVAAPPSVLRFTKPGAILVTLTLEQLTYDAGVADSGPLSGKGELHLRLNGGDAFVGHDIPFDGILADSDGQVRDNAAGYALKKELTWENALGTGTDLTLAAGSQVIVATDQVRLSATGTARLPFRTETGQRLEATLRNASVVLTPTELRADTDLQRTDPGAQPLALAGFACTLTAPHLRLQYPTKPALTLSAQTVSVQTPLPNFLTKTPLTITATQFAVDESGLPSFSDLAIAALPYHPQLVASARPVAGSRALASTVEFAQPAAFGVAVTTVQGSVRRGVFESLRLTGDLLLPEPFTGTDGQRARLTGITLDPLAPSLSRSSNAPQTLQWAGVTLIVTSFAFDPRRGLHELTGTIQLPADLLVHNSDGSRLALSFQHFTLDSEGVTGTLGVNDAALSVGGLALRHTTGELVFDRSALRGGTLAGEFTTAALGAIRLQVAVSGSGVAVAAAPQTGLRWDAFGASVALTGGTAAIQNQQASLLLSGTATIPALKNATLAFTDLGVSPDGKLVAKELALTRPIEYDAGPVTAHLSRLSYLNDSAGERLLLGGDIKLPDSLPATGTVTFEGLELPSKGAPKLKGLGLTTTIQGVGRLTATLAEAQAAAQAELAQQNLKNALIGDALLALDCFAGVGVGGKFLLADNGAWYFSAEVAIPPGAITLPVPPPPSAPYFDVTEFHGAIGHNIRRKPNAPPGLLSSYAFADDQWLVEAGVGIGSKDQFSLWGPLTLSASFPQFSLSLRGDVAILTPRALGMDPNRKGYLELGWYGPDTFRGVGNLNYNLSPLYKATGDLELLLNPKEGHFYVGWPLESRAITVEGAFGINGTRGGVGLDLYPKQQLLAAFEEYGNLFGILKGKRGGTLAAQGDKSSATLTITAYGEGEVDFGIATATARADGSASVLLRTPLPSAQLKGRFSATIDTVLGPLTLDSGEKVLLGW